MLKVVAIVFGGLVVAAAAGVVWAFSLGQRSVSYTLHLTLLDAAGRPLPAQRVVTWNRGYPLQEHRLDAAGKLTLSASESFGASALTGPRRPEAFAIRLYLPDTAPLFYWFNVKETGPVGTYEVYNDYYSYNYTQWVGDFDAARAVRRQAGPDHAGKTYYAVPPTGGQVPRWQATATVERAAKRPDGGYDYTLGLTLQQSGVEVIR
jgi:hypothetical protein